MDNTELQLRLSACRPHGQDADDPLLRAALESLPRHPDVAARYEQQMHFDRAMCKHLEAMPVPAGLRAEVLAALKISQVRSRRAAMPWLAAAAMVAAAVVVFWLPERKGTMTFAEAETSLVKMFEQMQAEGMSLDHVSHELDEVSTWLADAQAPLPYVMHAGMRESEPMGCRVIHWQGSKVTLICFRKAGDSAHLFVMDRAPLAEGEGPPSQEPMPVHHVEGRPVSAWGCRKCLYVLVGGTKGSRLDEFF